MKEREVKRVLKFRCSMCYTPCQGEIKSIFEGNPISYQAWCGPCRMVCDNLIGQPYVRRLIDSDLTATIDLFINGSRFNHEVHIDSRDEDKIVDIAGLIWERRDAG